MSYADLASRDLIELWRTGSQEAARIFWARYEVRLVALVAARLNRRFRNSIAAEDVVQSAMGSFFRMTRADAKPTVQLESTASAWNILATFTRRKLSRVLERESAFKRGGGWDRASLDQVEHDVSMHPSTLEADEILADLNSMLTADQSHLLELLLGNATQREIADRLKVDERTVRRRIAAIRTAIAGQLAGDEHQDKGPVANNFSLTLPNITYRQFVLGKIVGSGALGKVFRARLQSDGQCVAVKFMHRHLWTSCASRLSFLREIEHASRISHPGILKYLGWGQSPHGGPYLVSEFVDGFSLTNLRPDDVNTRVELLLQICHAIEAAHKAGVVHGDLTPNNVLLTNEGRIVITDFGFAARLSQTIMDSGRQHSFEPRGGTLGFAAPEQVSPQFGCLGPATDIYAIGGLAYYFLTGREPHVGKTDSLIDTISDEDVPLAWSARTPAESKLARVASLALKKAVVRRPNSVSELLTALTD